MTAVATYLFAVLGVASLVSVVGIAAGWFSLGISDDVDAEIGYAVIAVAAVLLAVSLVLAILRLGRIRRTRLVSGGALVRGISGAFFALDFGLARDIVVERRAVAVGSVRPKRGRGLGRQALVWREWQRLLRFPQPLFMLAVTLVVPYACDALGMSTLTPVVAALALFGASVPLLGGLRVLTRTGGLSRCLPFSLAQLKISAITVPAILVAAWAVLTTPAYLGFGDGAVDAHLGRSGADGDRHRSRRAAGGDPLGSGQGARLQRTDDLDPVGRVPARTDVQRVPRLRRLPDRHRADAARLLAAVVTGDLRHRRLDPAQLDGRGVDAGPAGRAAARAGTGEEAAGGRVGDGAAEEALADGGERPAQSTLNWIWCQPRAPLGNTLVRSSGWTLPVPSVARTWAVCRPAGPS